MQPAKILERLERAAEMIAQLPGDIELAGVHINGFGTEKLGSIHFLTPFQRWVEAGVMGNGTWKTVDDPRMEYLEKRVMDNGFLFLHQTQRQHAAPGAGTPEAAGPNGL